MAVLEDIRKKGGIIVSVVIGLALLAFIIGDFLPGRGGTRSFDIAKIGGSEVTVQNFEAKIEEVTDMYKQQSGQSNIDDRLRDMIHDQAWQMLINETVMQQEYEQIGLTVSPEELMDIINGPNPNARIRQYFTNPQTGEFDRSWLINTLKEKNMDPNLAYQWSVLEKSLLDERYMQKYSGLTGKGIYVPDFMAENEDLEINKKADFDYIVQKYTSIPDSTIKVSKDDLKAYYEKHKKQWDQTASRDIEYVAFNIVPSDEDRAAAQTWIEKIQPEFEQAPDPEQFIKLNSKAPADMRFLTREQLPVQVTELFDEPVGTMVGPYQEGEALKLVRLAKVENRPDSVKMRQIIILPKQQTQESYMEAITLADSVKTAIGKGADFAEMVAKYSADPSAVTTKGELGWIQESEMQAGSIMESLFSLKKGEVSTMETGQGIFVVQVTERGKEVKKVQIATLQYDIMPSSNTERILYAQASKFAIENRSEKQFDATSAAQNLNKRAATYLGENDRQIPGLTSVRQVVRWAYEAKRGDVSDVFTVDNSYVVAVLKNIRKKGIAPINQVAAEIDLTVRREKKAAQIAAQLSDAAKNAQSFSDLAITLNLPIETATAITFSAFSVPGAGIEPQLIATATTMGEGNISQPVEGVNGVYLLTVKQIAEPEETGKEQAKERLGITYSNRSMSESVQALRKAANVEDRRSKFY
jgi:peptidyl-prolyl cis-trans isomerase D